jgi:imidazolonepropionase-like amidohydrolase
MVGVTIDGVKPADLRKKLVMLVESGLSERQINQLLTSNTASILGVNTSFGSLKTGYQATMAVFSGEMTNKDAKLMFVTDGSHLKEAKSTNSTGRGQR